MAVVWKKLAYADDVVLKSLFTTKGDIVYASAANTPVRLGIGADTQVLKVNVDVPAWADLTVASHALSAHTAATAALDFGLQEAQKLVVHTVVNEAGIPTVGIKVGQLIFATAETTLHICTSDA